MITDLNKRTTLQPSCPDELKSDTPEPNCNIRPDTATKYMVGCTNWKKYFHIQIYILVEQLNLADTENMNAQPY